MKGKLRDFYIDRDATLTTWEEYQKRVGKDYDSALEAIVTLTERVARVEEGESKTFWENNLRNLQRLFPLMETLIAQNTRLRGSFQSLHTEYTDVLVKYRELEEKYNRLTDKLI